MQIAKRAAQLVEMFSALALLAGSKSLKEIVAPTFLYSDGRYLSTNADSGGNRADSRRHHKLRCKKNRPDRKYWHETPFSKPR